MWAGSIGLSAGPDSAKQERKRFVLFLGAGQSPLSALEYQIPQHSILWTPEFVPAASSLSAFGLSELYHQLPGSGALRHGLG